MDPRTVLAFRIFVMLSCLIIVPMAAIFGSAFPDVVKGLLVDRLVYWATGKAPEANRDAGHDGLPTASPRQDDSAFPGGNAPSDAPRWENPSEATSWQAQPPRRQSPAVDPPGINRPAAYSEAAPDSPGDGSVYASGLAGTATSTAPPPSRTSSGGADQGPAAGGALAQLDPFTATERKLRAYGATYYLLETWGNDSQMYRFHCKMAIGSNPNYTRHFEATDRDALQAMKRVLDRVEAWRAGQPR